MTAMPKVFLATVIAAGLYIPGMSAADPFAACRATAAPSPSCSSDLRECLRSAARETIYGARYVPAEDVARCVDAYNACISGGASGGGNQSPPDSRTPGGNTSATPTTSTTSSSGGDSQKQPGSTSSRTAKPGSMPPMRPFTIADSLAYDCQVDGDSVACYITRRDQLPETMDSWTARFTGTLSGSTMTGTQVTRTQSHYTAVACIENSEGTQKISYTFNPDGTVKISSGAIQWHTTNCSESHDNTSPANESTANWS